MSVKILNSFAIEDSLNKYRKSDSDSYECYQSLRQASSHLAHSILVHMQYEQIEIKTLTKTIQTHQLNRDLIFVPKIRAGLVMLESFIEAFKTSTTSHILIQRGVDGCDEVLYSTLPKEVDNNTFLVLDTLVGTGKTINILVQHLIEHGIAENKINVCCLMSTNRGISTILAKYPSVEIYVGILTEILDSNAGVYPKIGDLGDRIYKK